jgi:hypothetical protein
VQLFSFSLYDEDNKGYITKEDLDRCAPLLLFAARISLNPLLPPAVTCGRVSVMLGKEESAVCDGTSPFTTACKAAPLRLRHTLAECS